MVALTFIGFWIIAFPMLAFVARALGIRRAEAVDVMIRQWAEFNDYQVVQLERCRGFVRVQLGCSTSQLAYLAMVIVPTGEVWACHLIYGGVFNPMARHLQVIWDGPRAWPKG